MKADKMQRARIALLLDEQFFGTLLVNLKSIEDKAGTVTKTMATDGKSLWWHTKFVDALSEREVKTVLAHEALHVGLLHPLRRGTRDNRKWNMACDHAVNLVLEESNEATRAKGKAEPFPWPKLDIYRDPAFKGMGAEAIYNKLPQEQKEQQGSGDGEQGIGGVLDAPGDEAEQKEQEASIKVAMVQAMQAAKMAGNLPAGIKRLVEDTINPPASWQDLLRSFVRENACDDFSWTKPNARYAHTGFILPSLHSQKLGRIAVAVDTSGSIDADLLNSFLGELEGICAECKPSSITLIDCDAQVNSVRECDPADPLPRDFAGGGGTDFSPVLRLCEENPPTVLIYFTDGDGRFDGIKSVSYPVLWALSANRQMPFGEQIIFK